MYVAGATHRIVIIITIIMKVREERLRKLTCTVSRSLRHARPALIPSPCSSRLDLLILSQAIFPKQLLCTSKLIIIIHPQEKS